jgi:hypothetical protein
LVETIHCTLGAGFPVAAAVNVAVAPASTVAALGWLEICGATSTVRVAGAVDVVPTPFVKTASYWSPLSAATALKLSVGDVAPATSTHVPPLDTIHRTVGAGFPVAAAVKTAAAPASTVVAAGWLETSGAKSTVSVAGLVVAVPALFVKTASYSLPLSAATALKLSVGDVAPATSPHVPPLLLDTIH